MYTILLYSRERAHQNCSENQHSRSKSRLGSRTKSRLGIPEDKKDQHVREYAPTLHTEGVGISVCSEKEIRLVIKVSRLQFDDIDVYQFIAKASPRKTT